MKKEKQNCRGYSLFEMMVVVSVFALLGFLVTSIVTFSLRGARKSEASTKVRTSLDYAVSIMERQLRNAERIVSANSSQIIYLDRSGRQGSFTCGGGQVASQSASLTSSDIDVTSCTFGYTQGGGGATDSITISLTGKEKGTTGPLGSQATVETLVNLRNY